MKCATALLPFLAMAMLLAPALAQPHPLVSIRRNNPDAVGGFDHAWVDSETWCTGQLIYDITNNGNNTVDPFIEDTWTVHLPEGISLADPQSRASWGFTTTAGVGQTLSFPMTQIGFYMSRAGTDGDEASSAFALALRCLADQPIDWSTECSCSGLEDVTINQNSNDDFFDFRGPSDYPVVSIPLPCAQACAAFPDSLHTACTRCLIGTGHTPDCGPGIPAEFSWQCIMNLKKMNETNTTWSPPRIKRLPAYESGLTSLPAFPLMNPQRWMPAPNADVCKLIYMLYMTNFQYTMDNVTMCNLTGSSDECVTMPVTSRVNLSDVAEVVTNNACTIKQGWINTQHAVEARACPGSPPIDKSLINLTFNEPEMLALMHPQNKGLGPFTRQVQAEARQLYTDVNAAADSLWLVNTQVYAPTLWYKNITTPAEIERLQEMYGDKWDPEWEELAARGDLVGFDLLFYNGMGTGPSGNPMDRWNNACHCMMRYMEEPAQYRGSRVPVRVIAVLLGNVDGSTDTELFTPELSETAFILAMSAVRSAFTAAMIWYGHTFQLHAIQGAAMYSLYNAVEPVTPVGLATHPVRQLLDPYLDPSMIFELHSTLWAGGINPPPTAANLVDMPLFFDTLVSGGKASPLDGPTFFSTRPDQQLKWSGLDESRFAEDSMPPWFRFEQASQLLEVFETCKDAVVSALQQYYPDDAAVRNDQSLQAWRKAMLDPLGGNMIQITVDNRLDTQAKLLEVCANLIYQSVVHNAAKLQDWTGYLITPSHLPIAMTMNEMPDPTAEYTVAEMVGKSADAYIYARTSTFASGFPGAPSFTALVPGPFNFVTGEGLPDFEADLPFYGNDSKANEANRAIVQMRRDLVDLYMGQAGEKYIHNSRNTITNWGKPLVMARAIEL
eukprot:gene19416-26073_t